MEEEGWVKDTKAYLVFRCRNCDQYSYVRPTQKTKKCLRCGRVHQVKNLGQSAIKVKGISEALKEVQARQNKLGKADFSAEGGFVLAVNYDNKKYHVDTDNTGKLREIITKLSQLYDEFPLFMVELMAEDSNIPKEEIKSLINILKNNKILKETVEGYFILIKEKKY